MALTQLAGSNTVNEMRPIVNDAIDKLEVDFIGSTAPSAPRTGSTWLDNSAAAWPLKKWDGSSWITIIPDVKTTNGGLAALGGAAFTGAITAQTPTGTTNPTRVQEVDGRVRSFVHRIGGLAASDDRFLWSVPASAKYAVVEVYLISDTDTTGSDGSNNWTFQVRNLTAGNNLIATAKTTNGAEISADTRYALVIDQNQEAADLDGGDVLELQVTKTGSPTDLASAEIMVQVDYTETVL